MLLFFLLFVFVINGKGQVLHSAGFHELNIPVPGSHIFEASSYVELKQEFVYTITTPNSTLFWARVDENVVGLHPYQEELVGEERELNKNYAVGSLPGSFNVSGSGSATYQVPIEVPPGTNGMVPSLAISYSSSAGNGLLGMGFDLVGFSSISRAGKDVFHDGVITAVNLSNEDKFVLDGERLLLVSGTYGVAPSEYRPESQYYTKVLLKSNGGNLYFEVWTKGGMIKEYGLTDDARIESNVASAPGVYTWQLNKIKDYNGNYIQYNYYKHKETGEYRIQSISYTGNDILNTSPYNEIKFFYDLRDDKNTTYRNGSVFQSNVILRKIKTFCEGKLVKIYNFKYSKNLYSHLNEILLATGDGSCINSTVINWGTKTEPVTTTFDGGRYGTENDDLYIYKEDGPTYFTDVNGDGNKELLAFPSDEQCSSNIKYLKWKIYKYDINDNNKKLVAINDGCLGDLNAGNDTLTRVNLLKVVPMDIDMDGKDELLFLTSVRYEMKKDCYSLIVLCRAFKFDENNELKRYDKTALPNLTFCSILVPSSNRYQYNKPYLNNLLDYSLHIADFNGDGFLDFLYRIDPFLWTLKTFKNTNNQWSLSELGSWDLYSSLNEKFREEYINSGDFDGDGRAELLWEDRIVNFKTENNVTTWEALESAALHDLLEDQWHTGYQQINGVDCNNSLIETRTGDFNGDGISDILYNFEAYTRVEAFFGDLITHTFDYHWHIAYGKGEVMENGNKKIIFEVRNDIDNFKKLPYSLYQNDWNYSYQFIETNFNNEKITYYEGTIHRLYVADVNNDGRSDIIDAANQFGGAKEAPGSQIKQSWIDKILISTGYNFKNINQNNDLILYKSNNTYMDFCTREFYIFNDFTGNGNLQIFDGLRSYDIKPNLKDQKVVSIVNGYNSKVDINYKTLLHTDIYEKGSGSVYPLADASGPLCVVHDVINDNGTNEGVKVKYFYKGLTKHIRGKGSLGFMENTITNMQTKKQSVSTYEIIGNIFYDKALKSSITQNSETDQKYSEFTINNYIRSFLFGGWYIHYIYPNETVSKNYLTNTMVTNEFSYDDYMNVLSSSTSSKQISASTNEWYAYSIYYPYTLINNATSWIPGIPGNVTTTSVKNGEPSVSSTKSFTYYDNGKLKTAITEPSNDNKTTATFLYDDVGNTRRMEVSGKSNINGNIETRWMDFEFNDGRNRFVTKITNSKGHNALTTFDPLTGNALTSTDANGNLSKFTYDNFGRPHTATTPDNNTATATVEWVSGTGSIGLFKIRSEAPGSAPVISYYDHLMRPLRMESKGFNNETLYKDYSYNAYGYKDKESLPYFAPNAGSKQWTNFNYDPLTSRLMTVQGPAVDIAYNYQLNKTTLTDNIMGVSTWILTDAAGNITQSHDNGGTINFAYNSQGLIKTITDPSNNISSMSYDIFGNQTSLSDPDAGITSYTYDAFGQLLTQTDARMLKTEMEYDELGRPVKRKEPIENSSNFITTNYTYDTKTKGVGMLSSITTSDGYAEEYNYDTHSRPISSKTTIDGVEYIKSILYDRIGRVKQYTYPSGFAIRYNYNPGTGDLVNMLRADNNQIVWQCSEVNALGQIEKYALGNGLISRQTYDPTSHMLTGIKTGTESNWNVQNLAYIYNSKMQLTERKDMRTGYMLTESFTYDGLNRLTSTEVEDNLPITIAYDVSGNITSKSDAGTYSYELPKPHAFTKIITNDGVVAPVNGQNILYNTSGKVSSITEGNMQLFYKYGAGQQRIKSELYRNGNLEKRKYYVGNYEKEISNGITRELHYIASPSGLVGIMERKNGENKMYYVHTDIQGSFNSITDESGNIVQEMNFDAWGKRRNPTNWSYDNLATTFLFDRGYTGHEHLDAFGLINMNGRVYDPMNGRFLSPDPIVHDPFNTQCYNRYSYCFNNPILYTDPSGYDPPENPPYITLGTIYVYGQGTNLNNNAHNYNNNPSSTININYNYQNYNSQQQSQQSYEDLRARKINEFMYMIATADRVTDKMVREREMNNNDQKIALNAAQNWEPGTNDLHPPINPEVNITTYDSGPTQQFDTDGGAGVSGGETGNTGGDDPTITHDFPTKKDAIDFMIKNSFNLGSEIEIGAFMLRDNKDPNKIIWQVQPWVGNDKKTTNWPTHEQMKKIEEKYTIIERYHTHPMGGDPSETDHLNSNKYPSWVIRQGETKSLLTSKIIKYTDVWLVDPNTHFNNDGTSNPTYRHAKGTSFGKCVGNYDNWQ